MVNDLLDPNTHIGAAVFAVIIVFLAWVVSWLVGRLLERANWVMGHLGRRVDETVVRYVVRFAKLGVYLFALVVYASLVPVLKSLMGAILASAGITALVMGFAAKSTLANLISGLSLAIYRPVRIGDKVTIGDEYGTIEDITLRHTIVKTWEYKRLVIPNAKLDEMTLVNYSLINPEMMCKVELGVSYDTDIDLARRLILEEVSQCPQISRDPEKEPYVRVISHGDFSIGLRIYTWVANADDMWSARWWLLEHIKKRFDKEGVEIPFPYRTLVYKKDLPPPRREGPKAPADPDEGK
jgi:small-conductance mechanosensitive channel